MFEKALLDSDFIHVSVIEYMLEQGATIRGRTLECAFRAAERRSQQNGNDALSNDKKIITMLMQNAPNINLIRRTGKSFGLWMGGGKIKQNYKFLQNKWRV